jgi:hypothetical protein
MRAAWIIVVMGACGGGRAEVPGVAPATPVPPVAPDVPPVGAMPIPADDGPSRVVTLDEVDTTITLDDLRAVRGAWPTRARLPWRDRVMLALHAEPDGLLHLTAIQSDEGERRDYPLGAVTPETFDHTFDGNAYLSRQGDEGTGPIVFAVRVLPPAGAASATRRQVVVYSDGASLRVVDRPLGTRAWRPRLRLDFPAGTVFVGIGTTDPH